MGEFLVLYGSALFANWIFAGAEAITHDWSLSLKILLIALVCQICLYYNDLYDFKVADSFSELGIRLTQVLGATTIVLACIYSVFPKASMGLKVFVISICFDFIFIVSWRIAYTFILNNRIFDEKISIIGSGELARNIIMEVSERIDCGYFVSGVVLEGHETEDINMRKMLAENTDITVMSHEHCEDICEMIKNSGIHKIIVAIEDMRKYFPKEQLLRCRVDGIEIMEGSSFYEMLTGKLLVDHIKPAWLIFSEGFQKTRTRHFLKRFVDLTLSVVMLIILLPLILFIAILIKIDTKEPESTSLDTWRYFAKICSEKQMQVGTQLCQLVMNYTNIEKPDTINEIWFKFKLLCKEKGLNPAQEIINIIKNYIIENESAKSKNPVFFSQKRMGMKGRIYKIYKFRSMIVNAERISGPMWAGENDKRITRIGNFIRKWRIDELPQLWNVLKGEMSFVGPRPEREFFVKQLEKTIPYYRERLSVKPGLTGWAQVSYGYGATEDDAKEKLNYDLFYIKNMSISMDMMIVLKTIKIVIFGKGR